MYHVGAEWHLGFPTRLVTTPDLDALLGLKPVRLGAFAMYVTLHRQLVYRNHLVLTFSPIVCRTLRSRLLLRHLERPLGAYALPEVTIPRYNVREADGRVFNDKDTRVRPSECLRLVNAI